MPDVDQVDDATPRLFQLYAGEPGAWEPVADGVQFADSTTTVRWYDSRPAQQWPDLDTATAELDGLTVVWTLQDTYRPPRQPQEEPVQRHRYATRDELADLVEHEVSTTGAGPVADVFDALATLGVDLGQLVRITVDEDVTGPLFSG